MPTQILRAQVDKAPFRLFGWLRRGRAKPRSSSALGRFLKRSAELLRVPEPETEKLVRRIGLMERDIFLPGKIAAIAMLFYSFYRTPWIGVVSNTFEVAVESIQYFFWLYILASAVVAVLLLTMRHLPLTLIEWAVFTMLLGDGIFLSALTLVTGGYDSILYWLFLALIVRTSVSVPRGTSQLMLNFTLIIFYVFTGLIDLSVAENLEEPTRRVLGLPAYSDNPAEPLLLRLLLMLLMTFCCYALQVLLERQRQANDEAREFALREGQLHSAGRLAAEFAHQIKNPLSIINNAAFTLKRSVGQQTDSAEQIRIIQEEVDRSDRIITEIMGYAQLSEGRVEKIDVPETLDQVVREVFPAGSAYAVKVHREYARTFPPLLVQRRHFVDAVANLLQNAREAFGLAAGNIWVRAHCRSDYSILVEVRDDGPGIPRDRQEQIFEAYFTTKEKGTGLGLATVKHNVELYGGTVKLESSEGKGCSFTLLFPGRTVIKLSNKI